MQHIKCDNCEKSIQIRIEGNEPYSEGRLNIGNYIMAIGALCDNCAGKLRELTSKKQEETFQKLVRFLLK